MAYHLKVSEKDIDVRAVYLNSKGNAECVEFVRQTTGAPATGNWRQGKKVSEAVPGEIRRGTAIATFDSNGRYPKDALGRHAAIYISHNQQGILVLDQWNAKRRVSRRIIRYDSASKSRSNDANTFYIIE